MGRKTVYNDGQTTNWDQVSKKNQELLKDFIIYLNSCDKSKETIKQYEAQLKIFFCWNQINNDDTFFVNIKKRQFTKFFNYLVGNGSSPKRIASIKYALSSLSNYIERILDDEYEDFKNIVKVLETPVQVTVRKKTVLTEDNIDHCLEELIKNEKYQMACYLALCANSGMRISEVEQVLVSDFDPDKEIFGGTMYETHEMRTKGHGTKGKVISRYVFKNKFDKYKDLWLAERNKEGINSPYLFVIKNGDTWKPAAQFNFRNWNTYIEQFITQPLYTHSLRHYCVSQCVRQKIPQSVIIALFKWSSADMFNIYNDVGNKEQLNDFFTTFGKEEDKKEK